MSQRSMFSTRARPNQMLKRERERLTKLVSDFIMKLEGATRVPTKWVELPSGAKKIPEYDYQVQTVVGPLRITPYGW